MISLDKDEAKFALEVIAYYLEENRSFLSEFEDSRPLDLFDRISNQLYSLSEE